MKGNPMTETCTIAFEKVEYSIPISKIIPQRVISERDRRRARFKMIACSLKAAGLIEALVVHPTPSGMFLLLDGHSRLELLRELGETAPISEIPPPLSRLPRTSCCYGGAV